MTRQEVLARSTGVYATLNRLLKQNKVRYHTHTRDLLHNGSEWLMRMVIPAHGIIWVKMKDVARSQKAFEEITKLAGKITKNREAYDIKRKEFLREFKFDLKTIK